LDGLETPQMDFESEKLDLYSNTATFYILARMKDYSPERVLFTLII